MGHSLCATSDSPVLITGSAGFVGHHLAKRLIDDGRQVVGIDNMNDYYNVSLKETRNDILKDSGRYFFVEGDISDEATIKRLFTEYAPRYVVNLAAQAGVRYSLENPSSYIKSNIVGFFNILEACRNHPVEHLVYASSSSVYGSNEKVPFSEKDRVDSPVSLYAATKKANELMAHSYSHLYGIPATGLRFFTVYGPLGRPDMAYFKFAEKMYDGNPILVYNDGDLYRDFTYIDDIVEGVEVVLKNAPASDVECARHRVYNIGNGSPVKLMDFISELEQTLGITAVKEYLPMQPGDVHGTYADTSSFESDFGFKPRTSLAEGLTKFSQWYLKYKEAR